MSGMFKTYLGLILVIIAATSTQAEQQKEITPEQLQGLRELVRKQCTHNIQVGEDVPNAIRDGQFTPDRNVKCYADCVLDHLHIAQKGKLLAERTISHASAGYLPPQQLDEYVAGIERCKSAGEGMSDSCDVAYEIAMCLHANNVKVFV